MSLDLETTGTDPQRDKIIEIGMVKLVDGIESEYFHSLINPNTKLPVKIKRLTGITDEMLIGAPNIEDVLPAIQDFIGDTPLLGHNVQFDRDFVSVAVGRPNTNPIANVIYDTVELARLVLPSAFNHRLATLCQLCNVNLPSHHRALDDARGAAFLAVDLVHRLSQFEVLLLNDLLKLMGKANSTWYGVVEQVANRASKEFGSRKITSITGLRPLNDAQQYNPEEEIERNETYHSIDETEITLHLGNEGLLSEVITNYEHRPQQIAMARGVTRAINNGKFMLAEAGTGTGKSMAYLLPAVLWAKKNNHRVVISTHTINLQEQLWNKDVPLLQLLHGMDFKACLVKGRSNFLCLRRWYSTFSENDQTAREAGFYARILVWLTQTDTGDRAELNFSREDFDLWNNICAESETCLGKKCRHFYNVCFVNRARRCAEKADIIIANHSLVLSNIAVENKLLPPYKILIMDEAHHLEDTATRHLGTEVTRWGVLHWLSTVTKASKRLSEIPRQGEYQRQVENLAKIKELQHKVRDAADIFFEPIAAFLASINKNSTHFKVSVRLKESLNLSHIQVEIENLVQRINKLCDLLQQMAADIESEQVDGESQLAREASLVAETGLALAADISFSCQSSSDNSVHWIDGEIKEDSHGFLSINAAPVKVGELLNRLLYNEKDCVVFTSATLTVDKMFDHFIERSGLIFADPERVKKLRVDSPFLYNEQSLLYVASDMPTPGAVSEKEYIDCLTEVISDISITFGGKTLVLFTSHKALKDVYCKMKPTMEEEDILLLGHNIDGGRSRLVEEFKTNNRSVLLGAASFWEGLDVPGKALSCVVLVRLPFWPPTMPVVEARIEALRNENKNGFSHFSLPEAIIKFKQGFGRLIRTSYDEGAVIVLDNRVITKRYGQKFVNSLPINKYKSAPRAKMLEDIKKWIQDVDVKSN